MRSGLKMCSDSMDGIIMNETYVTKHAQFKRKRKAISYNKMSICR